MMRHRSISIAQWVMVGLSGCGDHRPLDVETSELGVALVETDRAAVAEDFSSVFHDESGDPEDVCNGEAVYAHPLQFLEPVEGLLPIAERKNSPAGHRYGMEASNWAIEDDAEDHSRDGIVELERRTMTAAERAAYRRELGKVKRPAFAGPRILERANARVDTMHPDEADEFFVMVHKSGEGTLVHQLDMAVARGEVYSNRDYEVKREELLAAKRQRIKATLAPVVDGIGALGGEVVKVPDSHHAIRALLTPAQVVAVLNLPGVSAVDLHYDNEEFGNDFTDGVIGANIMQLDALIAGGYNGNNGSATDIHAAMFEWSEIQSGHAGYKDGSGSSNRFAGLFLCNASNPTCSSRASMNVASSHYIMTSGILMGDLEDGQESTITNGTERRRRSGYATEVNTYLYAVTDQNYADEAWNHMAARSPAPRVMSMSASWYSMSSSTLTTVGCNGDGIRERQFDEILYENGILPFKSAGNDGGFDDEGFGVCRLADPASALGAFVVGGYGIPNDYSVCNQRQHPLEPASSRGKGSIYNQGRFRSIIDGAAPFYQNWRFGPNNDYSGYAGGTSLATPAAAAMAVDLIDHHRNNSSNPGIYDDPGIVHVLMLLMGDRTDFAGNKKTNEFDSRMGAGRLKARGRTADMLDGPYHFGVGSTCVDDGETVTVKINYNSSTGVHSPVSSDVDYGKAVIWWYDRRFSDTGDLDDIDLEMYRNGSIKARSATYYDEKEMVYRNDANDGLISLQLIGDDVTADNEGCGTNSMKVYYAYRFEDNDRDDGDGPSYNTSTCVGVEPE